jgi:hypothetical protein
LGILIEWCRFDGAQNITSVPHRRSNLSIGCSSESGAVEMTAGECPFFFLVPCIDCGRGWWHRALRLDAASQLLRARFLVFMLLCSIRVVSVSCLKQSPNRL